MKNGKVKRKTMGEFQNKLFDTESCILNDPKGEIYIGTTIEEDKIILNIKQVKKLRTYKCKKI